MEFKIEKKLKNSLGRVGMLETPHGTIETPAFVAVGTKATVKSLNPEQVKNAGVQVVLGNTYHLYLQPGDEIVRDAGGIGKFMNYSGINFTDSGGFQMYSKEIYLSSNEKHVIFKNPITGEKNIPWSELPEDWICPKCNAPKADFKPVEEEELPSDENLTDYDEEESDDSDNF